MLIHELEVAVSHVTPERRAGMLHHITDLFTWGCGQYSEEQIALFDDVFMRLVAEIETSARAILAERLARNPRAPRTITRTLAFDDEIDVAGPILTHSERLAEPDLVENARTKGQSHLRAIAQRKYLPEAVTDVLLERGDGEVVRQTAENRGARFSEDGYGRLVGKCENNDRLAITVGSRPDIPRHHFLKLLAKASDVVRARLEMANPQAVGDIQQVVATVTNRIQARTAAESRDYDGVRERISSLHAAGQLREGDIASWARSEKFEETVVALSVMSGLSVEAVERAMIQPRPESLLMIMRAVGLSWSTCKPILLLRATGCAVSAQEIEQALSVFERLKPETARQVLRFQQMREIASMSRKNG
ncbi:MAG TPA: DUF2336 domain-containing protein [Xanthobacteraceae bacterium]|nr:DUF2336 domain-containing protein [Xanthobacteraceae bacterium]